MITHRVGDLHAQGSLATPGIAPSHEGLVSSPLAAAAGCDTRVVSSDLHHTSLDLR